MAVGKEFYWLAVFGTATVVPVPQPGADMDEPPPVNQIFGQQVTRSGTVGVSPGERTADVVKKIVTLCKAGEGVSPDALLVNIVLLPSLLIPR